MLFSPVQSEKASEPIYVTLFGMLTLSIRVSFSNACSPIAFTPSGMTTFLSKPRYLVSVPSSSISKSPLTLAVKAASVCFSASEVVNDSSRPSNSRLASYKDSARSSETSKPLRSSPSNSISMSTDSSRSTTIPSSATVAGSMANSMARIVNTEIHFK